MDLLTVFCLASLISYIHTLSILSCPNDNPQTKKGYLELFRKIHDIRKENKVFPFLSGVKLCNESISKPPLTGETFQFQDVTDRKVLVFSAYHEMRLEAGGPAIRIIATGWQRAYQEVGDLYCTFWYVDRAQGISVGLAEYINIYPSTAHPDMWCSHFILCPLPPQIKEVPYAISVTPKPCVSSQNVLHVTNREVVKKKGGHAVCYPVLHNRFNDWTMLVEFFELQRLLGAEEITIYNFSVSEKVCQVLKYFQSLGWLKVIPWPMPNLSSSYYFQRAAINDCVYRHMHRYEYVSVLDLDEVFIPRVSSRWPPMLEAIGKPEYGVYLFQHFYFRRNNSIGSNKQELLSDRSMISLSSFYRTSETTPAGKIRCKSMYRTDKVLKADVHFPYELVSGAEEYLVPPGEAALHHYRITPFQTFIKNPEKYTFVEDKYLNIYSKELRRRYQRHVENLF